MEFFKQIQLARPPAVSFAEVVEIVVGVSVAYFVLSSFYLLYLHPLSKFPGPRLWIISNIPSARSLRRGTSIHDLKKLHDRYGPVVRYTANELSFIDPQAWDDIYGHHGGDANFGRHPLWYRLGPNGAHTILSADNANHTRMRRLLSHAFSDRALKAQEHIFQRHFDLLIRRLREQADGRAVNMVDWFHFITFDITGDLEFGESFGCLEKGELHPWIAVMLSRFKRMVIFSSILLVSPLLQPFVPWLIPKSVAQERQKLFGYTKEKVGARLEKGDDPQRADFMSYVCRYNDEKGMTRDEIDATFEILVSASSETTATGTTGTLHYLLKHPDKLAKLRKVVREAFKSDKDITIQATEKLEYLTAVITEGLRLCPPAPTMLPRITPKGGAKVCGHWVPQGTSVGVPQWSTYRSATNFGNPDAFIPERWLLDEKARNASEAKGLKHEAKAYHPFSFGPRNCLGKSLAWTEMRILLSKLIWHFDMVETGEKYEWVDQHTFVMWDKRPLMVGLREVRR